jgi:hypothetical protein
MIPSKPELIAQKAGKPRPLRFAVQPDPGESLLGLLSRATRLNVLESMFLPLKNAGISLKDPARIGILGADVAERLATTLGCPLEAVEARLIRYQGKASPTVDIRLGSTVIMRQDLRLERRRISPLTLEQRDRHLSWWLLALLPFCPVSGERLRDDCSECAAPLGWRKSWGPGVCEHCEAVIKPSPEPMLGADLLEDYRHFAGLVSVNPPVREAALARLPGPVRQLSAKSLLDLCLRLGATCRPDPLRCRRREFPKLDPDTLTSVLTGGIRLLRDWPNGVQQWASDRCDEYGANGKLRDGLRVRLRGLAAQQRPDQTQLVQDALPDMFLNRLRSFADPGKVMLINETFGRLGINWRKLLLAEQQGILTAAEITGGSRRRLQFSTAEVEELARCLRGSSHASSLAWSLGVPIYGIEQLCSIGHVEPELHPGVLHLRASLHVKTASAQDLERRLREVARLDPPPGGTVKLALASRHVGGRFKPWASIIGAILDGTIPCWKKKSGGRMSFSVAVWPADLARFSTAHDPISGIPASTLISKMDAAEILNCSFAKLQDAQRRKLLHFRRVRKAEVTELDALLTLASRVISSAEFAMRTANTPLAAANELRRLDVPQFAFGWDRAAVTRLDLLPEARRMAE